MKKGKFKEVVVFSSNFHYGNGNFPKAGKAEMCSYFFALFLLLLPPTRKKAIQKSSLYREGIRNSFSLGVPELKKKVAIIKKTEVREISFILCQSIGGHQLLTIVLLFLQSFFF